MYFNSDTLAGLTLFLKYQMWKGRHTSVPATVPRPLVLCLRMHYLVLTNRWAASTQWHLCELAESASLLQWWPNPLVPVSWLGRDHCVRVEGSRCFQCGAATGTSECGRAMPSALLQISGSAAPMEGGKSNLKHLRGLFLLGQCTSSH